MKSRKIAFLLFLIALITTTCLVLIPEPPRIGRTIPCIDKIEHTAAFLVLSFLFAYFISGRINSRIRRLFLVVTLLGLYGVLMEILQRYTGRNFEAADLVADFFGALLGGWLANFFCD